MKLTKGIKQAMAEAIVADTLKERAESLEAATKEFASKTVLKLYSVHFGKTKEAVDHLKACGKYEDGMFRTKTHCYIRAEKSANWNDRIECYLKEPLYLPAYAGSDPEELTYFKGKDAEGFREIIAMRDKLADDRETLIAEIMRMMATVNTVRQFEAKMPMWTKYLPTFEVAQLPAVKIEDVLEKLNKAKVA